MINGSNNMIHSAIEDLAALGVLDAHELADAIIESLIAALARDSALPSRSDADWWLRLASTRMRIVEKIHRRIDGHVDADDVRRALEWEGVL
jgi:hypothetical protein